ncbi:MAG TPA: response regulator [Bryobacteraceae bacterium]
MSPNPEDHSSLESIFSHSKWGLYKADRLTVALRSLQEQEIGVVLCERDLAPGTWTDVLEQISVLPDAPPLIVTSRLADERLWAEALNFGVYDVLAKPFDRAEVVRSVSLAWLHWLRRNEYSVRRQRALRAAS